MKKVNVLSLVLLVFVLIISTTSCNKNKVASVTPNRSVTQSNQPSEPIKKEVVIPEKSSGPIETVSTKENVNTTDTFPTYQIIKTVANNRKGTDQTLSVTNDTLTGTNDEGQSLFVLIPALDLTNLVNLNYVTRMKNLIKQLVVLDKRSEFISIHVFDDQAALEKVFLNNQTTDLSVPVHYIGRFEAFPEGEVFRNTLTVFPIAPVSIPVIHEQTAIIQFNPFNW